MRGGKRPGAGRPREYVTPHKSMTVWVRVETCEEANILRRHGIQVNHEIEDFIRDLYLQHLQGSR